MILRLEGVTKRFAVQRGLRAALAAPFARPTMTAVDRVSFTVAEGEIFGLLGQNGAGKTTLFKILSTLILADEGRAELGGHDVATEPGAIRRLIAPVIANDGSLFWRLSALENVRLFAALQGLRGAEARAEEARVLTVTGLSDTGAKMVGAFSSGMRQRLLIARALLGRPRVLLLDEPTRSLDPLSAREFRRFLRETVVGAEGCTVLLATHNADEVWDLCDRVGVLERGRLLAVDATPVLRAHAGSDRYRVWLRQADGGAVAARLATLGLAGRHRGAAVEPGWDEWTLEIPGGAEEAARALAGLGAGGLAVARFEHGEPSLADLIERVLRAAGPADA